MITKIKRSFRVLMMLLALAGSAWAENASFNQTKTKLKQLNSQISQLKQTLASAHDKRGLLNQELAKTEKQIGEGISYLRNLQQSIRTKQQKVNTLQQRVNDLNKQLLTQQQMLAVHLRVRYKMGEYQPLKGLLNQDDPYAISRLLTFHQYLVQSRQRIIEQIANTRRKLILNQDTLKDALNAQQQLQQQLNKHQQKLGQTKSYHTAVIQSLDNEIQNKQVILAEYERNKNSLSQLLNDLSRQTAMQNSQPFTRMRKKLLHPVQVKQQAFQKMNQGLTFFAAEGTPVTAIHPGKVVFSDWLNGYGLLLIIDHGQGFMTLYAHNQSLFKPKGATVLQGEQIAAVGHSGGLKQNGLYFEVRHRGKAVPALDWLS